jgi:LytS/YehU family sensor histidine kinase
LYFKVHNSLHPKKDFDPEEDSSGVGLANVKKRLELIYPNRHTLDIQQSDKDYFVSLTLVYW